MTYNIDKLIQLLQDIRDNNPNKDVYVFVDSPGNNFASIVGHSVTNTNKFVSLHLKTTISNWKSE